VESKGSADITPRLSYKIIGLICLGAIFYGIGNALEKDIAKQVDLYEWIILLGYGAATILAIFTAKRYWGSNVFGKAYLGLAIGIGGKLTGWILWFVFVVFTDTYPYPYWPDLFFVIYYIGALIHLRTVTHYFIPKLSKHQKFILISMPVVAASLFIYFGLVMDASFTNDTLTMERRPSFDLGWDWYKVFFTGLGFVILSIFTLAYALIGFQVFRGGILGPAWILLLSGLAIKSLADIQYYYSELFSAYDRAHPMTTMWVVGIVIVAYALYKHKSL
jgi:hypothetical protein